MTWPRKGDAEARDCLDTATRSHPQGEAGHETDQSHSTSGAAKIASLGVTMVPVVIHPEDQRRHSPAMHNKEPCPKCSGRHLFRGELGIRRLPCGLTAILVEAVAE